MPEYVINVATSDQFAIGTANLLYSLCKNLKIINNCSLHVYYNILSEKNLAIIEKAVCFYSNAGILLFQGPLNQEFCKNAITIYGKKNQDCYLSFEAFRQQCDKSLYLDSDMLCIKDFSEIFEMDADFICCSSKNNWEFKQARCDGSNIKIQNAFMMMGSKYNNIYDDLIKTAQSYTLNDKMCDQRAINIYMRGKDIQLIPQIYNFKQWGGAEGGLSPDYEKYKNEIKLFHYSGRRKPWGHIWDESKDKEWIDHCSIRYPEHMLKAYAVQIWHQYYKEWNI